MTSTFFRPLTHIAYCLFALGTLCPAGKAEVVYLSVDFSAHHNTRIHTLQPACQDLPEGSVVLGGVSFNIPAGGNNAWWGEAASGPYPRSIDIPVGIFGVQEVHTLVNSSYGQPGPASFITLEFFGTNGAYFRRDLIGNEDVRDHFFAFWTNSINNTTTTNVALSGPGGLLNECRLDKQFIDLPDVFLNETLQTIRVSDSGGVLISGVILSGVTLGVAGQGQAVPEPSTIALLGIGAVGLALRWCLCRRDRKGGHLGLPKL